MTFTSMDAIGCPIDVMEGIQRDQDMMREGHSELSLQASKLPFARYDFPVKIALLGDSCCGKTSLLVRYSENTFHDFHLPTVAVDFRTKLVQVHRNVVKLQIWDIGAKALDSSLVGDVFLQNSTGVIICFDVTNRNSFENLGRWLQMKNNIIGAATPIIVGCKAGEDFREVSRKEAEDYASIVSGGYFETSSKLGVGVTEVFQKYSEMILSNAIFDGDDEITGYNSCLRPKQMRRRRTQSMTSLAHNMIRGTSNAFSSARRKLSTMSTDFSKTKMRPMTTRASCCSVQ